VESSLFVGELLRLLQRLLTAAGVAPFALKLARQIVNSPVFTNSCLEQIAPILIGCLEIAPLSQDAQALLTDSFTPYLARLEHSTQAQALLVRITRLTDSPPLLLIAAAFLLKRLPFEDIGRSPQEILAAPISAPDATKTLKFFSALIRTASRPLIESLVAISTDLLTKFGLAIDRSAVFPIYESAKQRISVLQSAIGFMRAVIKVDPSICGMTPSSFDPGRPLVEVRKGVAEFVETATGAVPITNCKQLGQLRGIIDQKSAPKIVPFATQFEVWAGLVREESGRGIGRRKSQRKRWSVMSTSGITQVMVASSLGKGTQIKFTEMGLQRLPHGKLNLTRLPIAQLEGTFVLSQADFMRLEDQSR
jgi:hypothetical protein